MSKVPRLTRKEQTVLLNCERTLDMEDWREVTRKRQRGELARMEMTCWPTETTPDVVWETGVETVVSPKPPPPKAPIPYWQDPKAENAAENGKDVIPNELIQKERIPKAKMGRGKIPKENLAMGKIPKEKITNGRISKEERHFRRLVETRRARSNYSAKTPMGEELGASEMPTRVCICAAGHSE